MSSPRSPLKLFFFLPVPLCRHGMRDDCPVSQCAFHNSKPSVLYSSALKGPTSATPALDKLTAMDVKLHHFGTHDKFSGEARHFQHALATPSHPTFSSGTSGTRTTIGTGPVDPTDGNSLVQGRSYWPLLYFTQIADVTAAADQVAVFRDWLESQMDAQKARIMAMSEQFSIPVPNLELGPFEPTPLSLMTPSVGNAVATTTKKSMMLQENNRDRAFDERRMPSAPPAPRMPPSLPVQGLWQPEIQGPPYTARAIGSGPLSARAPMPPPRPSPLDQGPKPENPTAIVPKHPQVTSIAPKKDDMAYKTTPCRHFTLNRGWCPWGDDCGL
jgi:hypothetical protein